MVGVKEALSRYPAFANYPWIVYGETHRKIHLGFNGEDVSLDVEWYNTGYDAAFASSDSLVRVRLSLSQRRNPVPRAKWQRGKNYNVWIPSKHVERYFAWEKVPEELPKVMFAMFDRRQRERLKAAYATLAEVFSPAIEHYELHGDTGDYAESRSSRSPRLTETEEVNDAAWQEICKWANDEWVGGGSVSSGGENVTFYSSSGALMLKFNTYKHNPQDPRTLYQIILNAGNRSDISLVFDPETEVPATLGEFLLTYAKKIERSAAYQAPVAKVLRTIRKQIKEVQAEKGYASLEEVYEYVINRLRVPVEHGELHTDTGYEESTMRKTSISQEKTARLLALFLRFVRGFDPAFKDWADLGTVEITADNPVWKTGGGGIIKVAYDVSEKFPLLLDTPLCRGLDVSSSNNSTRYARDIVRVPDVAKGVNKRNPHTVILNLKDIADWKGPVFLVETDRPGGPYEATRSFRFRFQAPQTVPSVESLAKVHSFKALSPGQIADVEVLARTAELAGLDNPVGRAAGIRQGVMSYAQPNFERLYFALEDPALKEEIETAWADFIKPFSPPEHYEMHTDTGNYDESVAAGGIRFPETEQEVAEAVRYWSGLPETKASTGQWGTTFERTLTGSRRFFVTFGLAPRQFCTLSFPPVTLTFEDLSRGGLPDDIYPELVRACREESDAFARLKTVRPATSAHWGKQFLLGINLEKKVPEEAFPDKPLRDLPAYFAKFSSPASATEESDLRLAMAADLTLIGE
jgi:hypothetical protein